MINGKIFSTILLALGLAGCQTFHVQSDWDPAISFPTFHEYFWVEPPEQEDSSPFADNTLMRKRIRFAVEKGLAERGFRASETREGVDFLVTYSVVLEERLRVDTFSVSNRALPRRYYGFGSIHSTTSVRTYEESTLVLDFLDPANDDLVWRGWTSGIVRTRDRNRGPDVLEAGVRAILEKFPPLLESS